MSTHKRNRLHFLCVHNWMKWHDAQWDSFHFLSELILSRIECQLSTSYKSFAKLFKHLPTDEAVSRMSLKLLTLTVALLPPSVIINDSSIYLNFQLFAFRSTLMLFCFQRLPCYWLVTQPSLMPSLHTATLGLSPGKCYSYCSPGFFWWHAWHQDWLSWEAPSCQLCKYVMSTCSEGQRQKFNVPRKRKLFAKGEGVETVLYFFQVWERLIFSRIKIIYAKSLITFAQSVYPRVGKKVWHGLNPSPLLCKMFPFFRNIELLTLSHIAHTQISAKI